MLGARDRIEHRDGIAGPIDDKLSAAAPPPGPPRALGQILTALALDSATTQLVWFETSKVLFVGSPRFAESVARVVSLDAPSIEQSPGFRDAQGDFRDQPNAIGYLALSKGVVASDHDNPAQALFDDYLKACGPITASFKLGPAGLVSRFVARSQKGSPTPPALFAAAQPLTIIDRLPAETFAYTAWVTKTELSGAELKKQLLAQLTAAEPTLAPQLIAQLEQAEQRLQLHFDQILGSIGDQAAVAVLAPPEYSLTLADPPRMLAQFALVYVQALKDDAPLRALAKQEVAELALLGNQYQVQADPDGYLVTPKDDLLGVSAQLRFVSGYFYLAIGGAPLLARSLRAFTAGESTLATAPAARAARAALPGTAQLLAWVDAGRIVDTVQKNPLLASQVGRYDLGALRWTGPDRITAGFALTTEQRDGISTYRVDALNIPVFAGIPQLGWP